MHVSLNSDLKNQFVDTRVGFDPVCKLLSNICFKAISAVKCYYFVCLKGRRASHVAFGCALQSHPNMVCMSGKYHGVLLIPEGLHQESRNSAQLSQDDRCSKLKIYRILHKVSEVEILRWHYIVWYLGLIFSRKPKSELL